MKMKMMTMALATILCLSACGGNETAVVNETATTTETVTEIETETVSETRSDQVVSDITGVNVADLYVQAMDHLENYDSLVGRNVMYYTTTMLGQTMEEVILREFRIVNEPNQMHIDTITLMDGNRFDETTYYEAIDEVVNAYYDSYSEKWYVQELEMQDFLSYQLSMLQNEVLKKAEYITYLSESEAEDGTVHYDIQAEISWETVLDMAEESGTLLSASMMGVTKDDLLEILRDKERMKMQIVIDENGFLQSCIIEMKTLMDEIMMAISGEGAEILATFDRAEIHIIVSEYNTLSEIEMSQEMRDTAETIG